MERAFFITGTDTGVGKTFVTSAIVRTLRARGVDVGVMKPVETGCGSNPDDSLVPSDARALMDAAGVDDPIDMVCPYRFAPPLAPNVAARLAGVSIDTAKIRAAFLELVSRHDVVLVEGAGGLLVPLTDGELMADLAALLSTPVVVVAPSRLGVINHTLLTVECAIKRGLDVRGIILNNPGPPPADDPSIEHNAEELALLADLPVAGPLPCSVDAPGNVVLDCLELIGF